MDVSDFQGSQSIPDYCDQLRNNLPPAPATQHYHHLSSQSYNTAAFSKGGETTDGSKTDPLLRLCLQRSLDIILTLVPAALPDCSGPSRGLDGLNEVLADLQKEKKSTALMKVLTKPNVRSVL